MQKLTAIAINETNTLKNIIDNAIADNLPKPLPTSATKVMSFDLVPFPFNFDRSIFHKRDLIYSAPCLH